MDSQPAFDGVPAEPPSGAGREERIAGVTTSFSHPDPQHGLNLGRQGDCPLLAPFSFAANVRASAENDIAAVEPHELRDAKAGLDGDE
jgi:hypothetical protein